MYDHRTLGNMPLEKTNNMLEFFFFIEMKLFLKNFLLRLSDFYLLKRLVFKIFVLMELISFDSICEFIFIFSSYSLA